MRITSKPLKGGLVAKKFVTITQKCVRSQVQFLLGVNNLEWSRQPPENRAGDGQGQHGQQHRAPCWSGALIFPKVQLMYIFNLFIHNANLKPDTTKNTILFTSSFYRSNCSFILISIMFFYSYTFLKRSLFSNCPGHSKSLKRPC